MPSFNRKIFFKILNVIGIYNFNTIFQQPRMVLKLPDGLSEYMVQLGIAAEFDYYSEWNRSWGLEE